MTIGGAIYGVILNDRTEIEDLTPTFFEKPYTAPPCAPVVYIKPRSCVTVGGAPVVLPSDALELEAAPTLALLFARDATGIDEADAWAAVGAACLAVDVSLPQANYYRPAVAQRCRDGFLPLGGFAAPTSSAELVTFVNDVEVHRWSTDRLVRTIPKLISDLSAFMTLRAGDLLLIGLPGDAPRLGGGKSLRVEAVGLPPVSTSILGVHS